MKKPSEMNDEELAAAIRGAEDERWAQYEAAEVARTERDAHIAALHSSPFELSMIEAVGAATRMAKAQRRGAEMSRLLLELVREQELRRWSEPHPFRMRGKRDDH